MTKHLLFVYGTLKSGYGNNARCLSTAKYIGKAISYEANFIMQSVGFPVIWQDNKATEKGQAPGQVVGEIYEIDDATLRGCDALEGHPSMYKRGEREFLITSGDFVFGPRSTAWVYLWQQSRDGNDTVPLVNGTYTWDIDGRRKMPVYEYGAAGFDETGFEEEGELED